MTFLQPNLVVGALLCVLMGVGMAQLFTRRKVQTGSWMDLVAKLHRLNFESVSKVAQDYLNPRPGQISMETDEIWDMVGGSEGLAKMCANAEVMLALAAHAQRWNFEEGVIVTERMRRDAIALRRAVRKVRWGLLPHRIFRRFGITLPFHVHEAVSAYYLMHQRLLALYQTSHIGLYPTLAATL